MASRISFLLQLLLVFAAIGQLLCLPDSTDISRGTATETSKQGKIPASLSKKGDFLRLSLLFQQKTKVVKLSRFADTKFSSMHSLSSKADFEELILARFPELREMVYSLEKAMLLRVWYQDTLGSIIAVDDDMDLESSLQVANYQTYCQPHGPRGGRQCYQELQFHIVVTPGQSHDKTPESFALLTADEVRNSLETSKRVDVPVTLTDKAGNRGFILLRLKFQGEIEVVKIGVNKEADTKLNYMECLSTIENFRHLIAERYSKVLEPGFGSSKTTGAGGNVLSVKYRDQSRQLVTVEDDLDLDMSLEFASRGSSLNSPYYQYLEFEIDVIPLNSSYSIASKTNEQGTGSFINTSKNHQP